MTSKELVVMNHKGGSLLPDVKRPAARTVEKYTGERGVLNLEFTRALGYHLGRVPDADLPAVIRELESTLVPAKADQVAKLVAILVGSYPRGGAESPEIYTAMMIKTLSEYPAWAIQDAVETAVRTLTFLPATAEIVEILDDMVTEPRWQLGNAKRWDREHEEAMRDPELRALLEGERRFFDGVRRRKSDADRKGEDDGADRDAAQTTAKDDRPRDEASRPERRNDDDGRRPTPAMQRYLALQERRNRKYQRASRGHTRGRVRT